MPRFEAARYAQNLALFSISVFLLSLLVGSFLNVVIYRVPVMLDREWRAQAAALTVPDGAATAPAEHVPGPASLLPAGSPNAPAAPARP